MSPRHATRTSYRPKEATAFGWTVKVSLHDSEGAEAKRRAKAEGVTPSEWARSVLRRELLRTP